MKKILLTLLFGCIYIYSFSQNYNSQFTRDQRSGALLMATSTIIGAVGMIEAKNFSITSTAHVMTPILFATGAYLVLKPKVKSDLRNNKKEITLSVSPARAAVLLTF